jgi:hypothetical protein
MADQDDKKKLMTALQEENKTLCGVFDDNSPFGMGVADERPANITLSSTAAQDISQRLRQSIALLPRDDFMPHQTARCRVQPEPQPPNKLPRVVETLPSQEFLAGVQWQQIKNLPGYAISSIRRMGRDVFSSFDCFNAMAQGAEGDDPLGEVLVASDYTHNQTAINFLAGLIEKHGVLMDKGSMDHGNTLPGYNPDVIIMMTQNWTFKLVRDRQENGAPVDLNSIYAWRGGLDHYQMRLERPSISQALPKQF